jgi:hypothetical protein
MKTQTTTPIEKITQLDFLDEDNFEMSYYAYDNLKKCNCIISFPKVPTSWTYSINYI